MNCLESGGQVCSWGFATPWHMTALLHFQFDFLGCYYVDCLLMQVLFFVGVPFAKGTSFSEVFFSFLDVVGEAVFRSGTLSNRQT